MLTPEQKAAAIAWATEKYGGNDEIALDVEASGNVGFSEATDAVWVQAWIRVPAEHIPGYEEYE